MTTTDRAAIIRSPTIRDAPTDPGLAGHAPQRIPPHNDAVLHSQAVAFVDLPVPAPQSVQQARAHLTARHATGVDEFLWEARKRPLPDREAIDAVITAGDQALQGNGDSPEPVDVAAALVVLSTARLNMDQTEARLLNTAQASGMGFEQIAAVLDLSVEEAEERYRRLKPRLDEPAAISPRAARPRGTGTRRQRGPARDLPTWDGFDDEDWGPRSHGAQ
jgi:hypothetical protein